MEPAEHIEVSVARTSQEHSWKLSLDPKLPARRQNRMRLALYWFDGLSVDEKERLVTGGECIWTVSRWDVTLLKGAAERAGGSLVFEGVAAPVVVSANEEEEPHGRN